MERAVEWRTVSEAGGGRIDVDGRWTRTRVQTRQRTVVDVSGPWSEWADRPGGAEVDRSWEQCVPMRLFVRFVCTPRATVEHAWRTAPTQLILCPTSCRRLYARTITRSLSIFLSPA